MPLVINEVMKLQCLSKIIIEVESRSELTAVKELLNLCGKISVVGVDNMKKATRAWEGNFSQKRLSELEVHWSYLHVGSQNEVLVKEVLDEVKPHNEYLEQLTIESYNGLEFPIWVGDPLFLRLKRVTIENCENCTSLPPLGQLPALKELSITGLAGVEVVGLEFAGDGLAFGSLEALQFSRMNGWKKWSTYSESVFPCLQQISIDSCPSLVEVSLGALPSLNFLKISECDSVVLRSLVKIAPSVKRLEIRDILGLNDVVWRVVIESLGAVEELSLERCNEIRYLCNNLVSLGEKEKDNGKSNLLTSLRKLNVHDCKIMERCSFPDSIEMLCVWLCNSITAISIPTGGQKLKSLEVIRCNNLLEREWSEQKMNNNRSIMPMLEDLYIIGWPNKKLMIELNYSVHLSELRMINCERLESLPVNNLTSLTELEIIHCPSMDVCGVWPPNLRSLTIGKLKKPISEWGSQKFPTSLVELRLWDEDEVSSCSQISYLLPSSLTSLQISRFEKLESVSTALQHLTSLQQLYFFGCPNLNNLSHLQHLVSLHTLWFHNCPNLNNLSLPHQLTSFKHLSFSDCPNLNNLSHPPQLTSLKHLSFYKCPNMKDLPEELLPTLLSLDIGECPKLKERCSKSGSYWPLISHIPHIDI